MFRCTEPNEPNVELINQQQSNFFFFFFCTSSQLIFLRASQQLLCAVTFRQLLIIDVHVIEKAVAEVKLTVPANVTSRHAIKSKWPNFPSSGSLRHRFLNHSRATFFFFFFLNYLFFHHMGIVFSSHQAASLSPL